MIHIRPATLVLGVMQKRFLMPNPPVDLVALRAPSKRGRCMVLLSLTGGGSLRWWTQDTRVGTFTYPANSALVESICSNSLLKLRVAGKFLCADLPRCCGIIRPAHLLILITEYDTRLGELCQRPHPCRSRQRGLSGLLSGTLTTTAVGSDRLPLASMARTQSV